MFTLTPTGWCIVGSMLVALVVHFLWLRERRLALAPSVFMASLGVSGPLLGDLDWTAGALAMVIAVVFGAVAYWWHVRRGRGLVQGDAGGQG